MSHDLQDPIELSRSFIFECLRARVKDVGLQTAYELTRHPGFDWDAMLITADEELVSPLLHIIFQGKEILPPPVEEALARRHDYIGRRNLFLLHELYQVLSNLDASGIDVIVLKGPALAEFVYRNIALRPMRDLDILIQREQRPAARQLLEPLGFKQVTISERDSYPLVMQKPGLEPVILELHWSLFHSPHYQRQLSLDWFWQSVRTARSSASAMRVLGLEAQILHLCGHLALHHTHEPQLLWHNDIAELIKGKKKEIHWDLLLSKAQEFQLVLPLRQVLLPLAGNWGAPVPKAVLQELQNLPVSAAETRVFSIGTAVKRSEGEGYWLKLSEISGWRLRMIFVLKWLFPFPAALKARYRLSHPLLLLLAYPYHLWLGARLAIEALLTPLRRPDS